MMISWTKQFLLATGVFAMVVTGQAINLYMKEKRFSEKHMEEATRKVSGIKSSLKYYN